MELANLAARFILLLLIVRNNVNSARSSGDDDEEPAGSQSLQFQGTAGSAGLEAILMDRAEIKPRIMEQYLELLTRGNPTFEHIPWHVFNHFVSDKTLEPQWMARITRESFLHIRLWFIPVSVHLGIESRYWSLAAYDVDRNILELYDPIKPGQDSEDKQKFCESAQNFFVHLQAQFGAILQRTPSCEDSILIPKHLVPEDSGVVALVSARAILEQMSIYAHLQFEAEDVPKYRKSIHDELRGNQLLASGYIPPVLQPEGLLESTQKPRQSVQLPFPPIKPISPELPHFSAEQHQQQEQAESSASS